MITFLGIPLTVQQERERRLIWAVQDVTRKRFNDIQIAICVECERELEPAEEASTDPEFPLCARCDFLAHKI